MFNNFIRYSILLFAVLPIGSLFELSISALSVLKCWFLLISIQAIFLYRIDVYRLLYVLCIIFIYLCSAYFSFENLDALVKDFFTVVFFFIVALTFWVSKANKIELEFVKKLIHVAVISDLVIYIIMFALNISPLGIRGVFFETTGILRYSDVFTYTIYFVSLFLFLREEKLHWLVYMNLVSVLALDRVFLVVSIFVTFYFLLKNVKLITLLFFCTPLFLIDSNSILTSLRFDELSLSHIFNDIFGRSLEPALMGGYQITVKTLFLGEGPGFLFYIPWFEYRGLASGSVSVDSLFISNFVKYGVIYLLFILIFLKQALPGLIFYSVNLLYLYFHNGLYNDSYLLFLSLFLLLKNE